MAKVSVQHLSSSPVLSRAYGTQEIIVIKPGGIEFRLGLPCWINTYLCISQVSIEILTLAAGSVVFLTACTVLWVKEGSSGEQQWVCT